MKLVDLEGYSVKSVKEMKEPRGNIISGNLFKGSTKIASYVKYPDGSPMNIIVINDDLYDDFRIALEHSCFEEYIEKKEVAILKMSIEFLTKKHVKSKRNKKTTAWIDDIEYEFNNPYSEKLVDQIYDSEKGREIVIANELYDIYPDNTSRVWRQ